jgi:hypothetical protein
MDQFTLGPRDKERIQDSQTLQFALLDKIVSDCVENTTKDQSCKEIIKKIELMREKGYKQNESSVNLLPTNSARKSISDLFMFITVLKDLGDSDTETLFSEK